MVYTLCYVSKAAEGLDDYKVEQIFNTTIHKNTSKSIHGILLYGMGDFFQILEGDKKKIEQLFEEQIEKDPRHSDIFVVMRKFTENPIFRNYSSLFNVLKTNEQLDQVRAYLAQNRIDSTSNKFRRLLNPFLLEEV